MPCIYILAESCLSLEFHLDTLACTASTQIKCHHSAANPIVFSFVYRILKCAFVEGTYYSMCTVRVS